MGRVLALAMIACLASCYQSPSLASCKYRCGGANNDSCPSGYSCNAGMCVTNGESCDGDGGVIDAPPDASDDAADAPIDAMECPDPGAFSLVPKTQITASGAVLSQIVALDADNDGKLDIVALDQVDKIGFYKGNGDGTFGSRIPTTVGANARKMIAGDFDHDGKRDDLIVLRVLPTPTFAILTSENNGMFDVTPITLSSDTPVDIANAGDVDGDGDEDAFVLYTTSMPRIQVYLQMAANAWQLGGNINTDVQARSLGVGYVNAGTTVGSIDAVVALTSLGEVGVHYGSLSAGTFSLSSITTTAVNPAPVAVAVGQLRSSGAPSIAALSTTNNSVAIRHWAATPPFPNGPTLTVNTAPKALVLANIGGNALPDVITADSGAAKVSVAINEGNNVFASLVTKDTDPTPVDVVAADFDGDQRLDVAVATAGTTPSIQIFLNECP